MSGKNDGRDFAESQTGTFEDTNGETLSAAVRPDICENLMFGPVPRVFRAARVPCRALTEWCR